MNTAQIVIREVQSASRFQVVQFLAKGIGQARKPSHHHSHGEVLPFNMTRTDFLFVRVSLHDLGYNLEDWTWGVLCRAVVLAIVAIQLDKLREIHITPKRLFNRIDVKPESVCGDLDAMRETLRQIVYECLRGSSRTLANCEAGNEFRNRVNGHENPSVSKFGGVFFAASFLLLVHKAPNFIGLKVLQ